MTSNSHIIFPADEKTALVRAIRDANEDYEALARCYNTFKDPESWLDYQRQFGEGQLYNSSWVTKDRKCPIPWL